MQEVLMLLFSTVLGINDTLTKDAFIELILEWNRTSSYESNIIKGIEWNGERNIRYGDEFLWLDIEEYRNENIIAVRYEKNDGQGTIWDTDYVMNFNTMKMSVRLDRSYTEEALSPDPEFSTPHFIKLLIDNGYIREDHGLPVSSEIIKINEDNLNTLSGIINGDIRCDLPVIYVSKTINEEDPVDVVKLAYRLKGAAHVLIQGSIRLNREIRELCGGKNEYYGAIGIYYPAFHRRFLYRSAFGYDVSQYEKVVRSVIQYGNAQRTDTLCTWQGVNNALLRDKLASKIEENDATRHEAEEMLDYFDEDMRKLKQQVDELTRANEILQYENQGLKAKLDSTNNIPVLFMGEEIDFYQGEVKDLILSTLEKALESIPDKTRRADVVKDMIENNGYQKTSEQRAEEIKRLLKNYDGMSSKTRQALKDLGFEITEDGKHYKITYHGDERYQMAYSKTPSDVRTGKNMVQKTVNLIC